MLVKIKPLPRQKWHGKEGIEDFSQPVSIRALYDVDTGRYATGLDDKKRKELEKKTGFNLDDRYDPRNPHEFWDSDAAILKLPNHTIILDTNNPLEEIKYHIARASKFVANSLEEYEEGKFPEATHVIFDEEQSIKVKAKKVAVKKEAYKIAMKLTTDEKRNIIMIISGKDMSKQSNDYLDVEIDNIINNKPEEFIEYSKRDKEYINTKALILEAVMKNILRKKAEAIYYMDEMIGITIEEAVAFINDPKNQNYKVMLMEKLS